MSSNYVDEDYPARPEIKQSLTRWGDNCGSESSTLVTDVCVWRYAPLVVHATQEEKVGLWPFCTDVNQDSHGRPAQDKITASVAIICLISRTLYSVFCSDIYWFLMQIQTYTWINNIDKYYVCISFMCLSAVFSSILKEMTIGWSSHTELEFNLVNKHKQLC